MVMVATARRSVGGCLLLGLFALIMTYALT